MRIRCFTFAAVVVFSTAASAGSVLDGHWVRAGLSGHFVNSLEMDPQDPRILYAGTNASGVFVSIDGGRQWISHGEGLASGDPQQVRVVTLDPSDSDILYAGTKGGLFRSVALGPWQSMGVTVAGSNPIAVEALTIDPSDSNRIFVSDSAALMRSVDGANFERVMDVEAWTVAHAPGDPSVVFAGRFAETFRSIDGGDTWTPTSLDDLINRRSTSVFLGDFYFDPSDSDRVYLTTIQGGPRLSVSTDAGQTYPTESDFPGSVITTMAPDPLNPGVVYASSQSAFGGNGTWQSSDSGLTWSTFPEDGNSSRVFTKLELSPLALDDERLFGAELSGGVWVYSKDRVFHSAFEAQE